jgi:hypothetical protein
MEAARALTGDAKLKRQGKTDQAVGKITESGEGYRHGQRCDQLNRGAQHAPEAFQAPDSRQWKSFAPPARNGALLFPPTEHLGLGRRLLVHAMAAVQSLLGCSMGRWVLA